ncbi:hypothetical protein IE077_002166 [Cardiosporidium cionae]|uniref:O-acyltransferase WSD1 C-terminal domain-containing protein n=1 Tax=Cardiosporidium cionae TaxID=476202 RepID=A0ABQ7JBD8_9APIC|nr:hypothetical protein IE077_002166 [Cardiosporidium cionae]|eukprot:KAF8821318.1 hypothetical protein IE077_002166 [Cardiosporidium cionae]
MLVKSLNGCADKISIPVQGRWFNFWKEVDVLVDDHIFHHSAPNAAAIHSTLESIMQIGYRADRPRWEIRFIKDLQADDLDQHPDARNVIVIRVDHSISDGVSLAKTCHHFLTNKRGEAFPEYASFGLIRENFPFSASNGFSGCFSPLYYIKKVFSFGCFFMNAVLNIFSLFKAFLITFYEVYGPFDSDSPLTRPKNIKKKLGVQRPAVVKFSKSPPISLSYVKQLKNKAHVSLNDILLSAFAGTLRRYCESQEFPVDGEGIKPAMSLRALLPYAFISAPEDYENAEEALRNRWVAVSIHLPVNKKDPLDRLRETFKTTQAMKQRRQPLANYYVHNFLGRWILPKKMVKLSGDFLFNKHSVVFATVPTTREECCFAGVLVEEFQVLFISVIPQVEMISYGDKIFFSLVFDADVVQNGNLIPQFFVEELSELGQRLQISGSALHGG